MKYFTAAAIAAVLLCAGVAYAASNTYSVEATSSPAAKKATKKKPVAISTKVVTKVGEASDQRPDVVEHYEATTTGIRINSKPFPTCEPSRIEASGSSDDCPKGSQVGSATATVISGVTTDEADKSFNCSLSNKLFNAKGGHVAIHITAEPSKCDGNAVNNVLDGKWTNTSKGAKFVYDVPFEQNHSVAGISSATVLNTSTYFKLTTKVKGKKVGYVEAIGCPGGKRTVTSKFRTEDGQTGTATDSGPC